MQNEAARIFFCAHSFTKSKVVDRWAVKTKTIFRMRLPPRVYFKRCGTPRSNEISAKTRNVGPLKYTLLPPPYKPAWIMSWMPLAREKTVPLAALSVCHVNIDTGCDFHVTQKLRQYMEDWKQPAPAHCRVNPKRPAPIPIHADRLGMETSCESFRPGYFRMTSAKRYPALDDKRNRKCPLLITEAALYKRWGMIFLFVC